MGIGKASKVSECYVARDPCDPPGIPEATYITKNSITLRWTKPEYDGGSKVTGYIVEKKDLPEGRWLKANFTNVIETEYTATGLTEDQKYEFRVIARNAAGLFSDPSYSTGPITAKDEVDPPKISIDPQYSETLVISAGENFKIDADIHGKPLPAIFWMKGEQELGNTVRREIKNTDHFTCLSVKEAKRTDGGEYILLLKNIGGEKSVRVNVTVLDKPGPPTGPISVTGSTLRLFILVKGRPAPKVKWEKVDGEMKERVQTEVTSSHTCLVIDNVNRFDSGKYTVAAENASGSKSAVFSVRVLDTPSAPVNLKVKEITKESVTLTWELPVADGGAKIKNYIIEKRESTRKTYSAVATNCQKTTWKIEPLQEGSTRDDAGLYGIAVSNVVGQKEATIEIITLDKPGPPTGPVRFSEVNVQSITISWDPPKFTGGCQISHYIVQKRDTTTTTWENVSTSLLEGNEYVFRVMAVNKYGISEALESSPVIMKNPFVPPGSPQILDVTNITSNSMTVCWAAPETDGGSEIITYIIEKKDRTGIRWTKCNRQKVTDVCFRVMGLSEDHEYEFRVSAENAAGDGEPSLPTSYYKASNPKFKPGPPVNVHVIDTTKNSILIAWGKPLNDGGSEIQGYIVEICKAEDEEWTLCTPPTGLRVNKFEIGKLTENQEYKIQVCAINKMGVGEPTAIPGTEKVSQLHLLLLNYYLTATMSKQVKTLQ
uniref:Titin-like n=1 Tax=Scleropages formosus TaxID=113540 RepID=A0A8C9RRD6_SCLFO